MTTAANIKPGASANTSPKTPQASKTKIFALKQWAMIKYSFSIERALIHMITAAVLFSLALFVKNSHAVVGESYIYAWLLFAAAGVQTFRACLHSMTPVVILFLVGFGGQYLLQNHIDVHLAKEYLQSIAGAGVIGLVVCCYYRLR
jgi:hypothetical protein